MLQLTYVLMSSTTSEPQAQQGTGDAEGFVSFGSRRVVRGQLYKITPIQSDLLARVQTYVENVMQLDHQYIRNLYGRVNPVLQKDYDYFWESPWLQEHGQDTQKRRRIEEQQKNMAVRNFMRSQQDVEDVEGYIQRVDQLMDWEERSYKRNVVKTVSRIVQSYELDAVRNIISVLATGQLKRRSAEAHLARLLGNTGDIRVTPNGVEPVAHTLRRNPTLSDLFVGVVASELILAVVCGGGSSVSIHMSRLRHAARDNAIIQLLNAMEALSPSNLPPDTVGLPLMEVNGNMCVRKGILVVTGGSNAAKYILDIVGDEDGDSRAIRDLKDVRTIHLTGDIISEDADPLVYTDDGDDAGRGKANSANAKNKTKTSAGPVGALV